MRYFSIVMPIACAVICFLIVATMLKHYGINGEFGIHPDAFRHGVSSTQSFAPMVEESRGLSSGAWFLFALVAIAPPAVVIAHHFWKRKG